MIINFHSSLKMAYYIHPPPSLCWNLVRSAQKGPSDSAFSVGMWLNRIEVFPLLTFLFSLSSHYRFWYKVLYIVVIRILACFCLRFAEIRVNISSFELTLKLTLSFSFFSLFMKHLLKKHLHTNVVTDIDHQQIKIQNRR